MESSLIRLALLLTASEASTRSNVAIGSGTSSQDPGLSPEKASLTSPLAAATASGGKESATSTARSTSFLSSAGSVLSAMSTSADAYGGSVSAVCAARTMCDAAARLPMERWSRPVASRKSCSKYAACAGGAKAVRAAQTSAVLKAARAACMLADTLAVTLAVMLAVTLADTCNEGRIGPRGLGLVLSFL